MEIKIVEVAFKVLIAMYTIHEEVYNMLRYLKYKKDIKKWRKTALEFLDFVNEELKKTT